MSGLLALIAAFSAFVALAVYLDHIAFDPFAAYHTDPRDLVDRAHSSVPTRHDDLCPIEFGFNACTCERVA